jgi:hypothetical protein
MSGASFKAMCVTAFLVAHVGFGQVNPSEFRIVEGRVYNIHDPKWIYLTATGSIVAQQFLPEGIVFQYSSAITMPLGIQSELGDGQRILVKNYPETNMSSGAVRYGIRAMRLGVFTRGTERLAVYDCGVENTLENRVRLGLDRPLPHLAPLTPQLRADQLQAAQIWRAAIAQRTVATYQSQAASGDGFAQLRLGEIYLHGEGVETNVALARKWLSIAATNGYPEATNKLLEIERDPR